MKTREFELAIYYGCSSINCCECGHVMSYLVDERTLTEDRVSYYYTCSNPDCKIYNKKFAPPKVTMEEVE